MNRVPKDWRHVLAILALDITILSLKFGMFSRSFVPASSLLPLQSDRVHPNNTCVKQYCVSMHEVSTAHRFGDEV